MKTFLILGGGTAGTMMANKIARRLNPEEWKTIVVDREPSHFYQPGFLFVPFGYYTKEDVTKTKKQFLSGKVEFIVSDIERIEPDNRKVFLTADNRVIDYDYLVVATGTGLHPEETFGLADSGWRKNIFDFYTLDGAMALHNFLQKWEGGRLVVHITEMPIKCPVAPLEFSFLADYYLHQRGIRNKVDLVLVTPLPGAFTKPKASAALGNLLEKKGITVVPDFNIMEVDNSKQLIRGYDEREIPYDLLVTIPVNMGANVIADAGMGDDLNYVPVDKFTLQSKKWENIWAIGDANNIPASKAGSVSHFQMDGVIENILHHMQGKPMDAKFDGHANCYIESGFDKAFLIDFDYDVEPLEGTYPIPGIGPFSLLKETRINHLGKLFFRWMYWNLLLPGRKIPMPDKFSMVGKIQ
ncbi:MAG: FAD/NAD(P)-binding oxidoreductase [Anaerolineaceae bacterium]